MQPAPLPKNESERLKTLKELEILDTHLEQAYDAITDLAAQICDAPICLISLIDENRQWFKSRHGLDAEETPRELAFCSHAILQDDIFEIKNAFEDERFHDNPLVTGEPRVIFYAGAVLKMLNQQNVGTLCIIDHEPRELTKEQKEALKTLADQVVSQFELRKHIKKLKDSNEKMTVLNKKKSQLYASVSHEIRTALNGIIGVIDLLKDTSQNDEQIEYTNIATKCGHNLLNILNDVLDMSKIESGKLELDIEPFSPHELVSETVQIFAPEAAKKSLSFGIEVDDNIPHELSGDATRIQQILINFISNALKFTESGGVTVKLSGEKHAETFNLNICVQDTGIGISKTEQEKLFKDYAQANAHTHTTHGGTGLGLSICKKLCKLMRGQIKLESDEGKGSTFTITIPLNTL